MRFEDNAAGGPHAIAQPTNEARGLNRRSKRLRQGVTKYNPTSGRSYKLHDDETKHPDFKRCYSSLVTDRMRHDEYIKNNQEKFCCTVGTNQPPPSARLCRKKREYKARIFRAKLCEANLSANQLEWEVPTPEALLHSDIGRFIHFTARDCGFDGTFESLVVNWFHPMMLQAKSKSNQSDNPTWLHYRP